MTTTDEEKPRGTLELPIEPIDTDPVDVYRGRTFPEILSLLDQAVEGMPLGAYDRRMLDWIKGADQSTVVVIASLLRRAREESQ